MEQQEIKVSSVRTFTGKELRKLDKILVVRARAEKLAVIIPYEEYIKMQSLIIAATRMANTHILRKDIQEAVAAVEEHRGW